MLGPVYSSQQILGSLLMPQHFLAEVTVEKQRGFLWLQISFLEYFGHHCLCTLGIHKVSALQPCSCLMKPELQLTKSPCLRNFFLVWMSIYPAGVK